MHNFPMRGLGVAALAALSLNACQQGDFKSQSVAHQQRVYEQAADIGDLVVATQAVCELLAADPAQESWRDTLMLLYAQRKLFGQSRLVSEQVLADRPSDTTAMKVLALSQRNLGMLKEAVDSYKVLAEKTNNIYHWYETAATEYALGRGDEALVSAQKVLTHPNLANSRYIITSGQSTQNVPLAAALDNLRGVIAKEKGLADQARQLFESALGMAPEFELAQNNLASLGQ